jgi:thioester reductase-like protein
MKIILTGATGMIGEGILIECLNDPRVHANSTAKDLQHLNSNNENHFNRRHRHDR